MAEQSTQSTDAFEAEQVLLGSLLVDPALLDEIDEQVSEGDFTDSGHAAIYRAISMLYAKWRHEAEIHTKVNIVSVCDFLACSQE